MSTNSPDMASNPPILSPEDSFISMRELDPSPIDDSPVEINRADYFPSSSQAAAKPLTRSTTSLGLMEHSTIWWLTRIQRYSSYAFSAFLAAHITNTSLIPLATKSVGASENYLLLTRPYYQSPIFEPLVVLAPIGLHVASGIALRLYRRRQAVTWYGAESKAERRHIPWPKLSGTSLLGYMFWPALAAHFYVNRGLPLMIEGGSSGIGLSYVAHGFARHPAVAYTAYAGLIGLGVSHIVWGWAKWLGFSPETASGVDAQQRDAAKQSRKYSIITVTCLSIALWAAGGLGIIARGGSALGWKGRNYDQLFRQIPLIGGWLAP